MHSDAIRVSARAQEHIFRFPPPLSLSIWLLSQFIARRCRYFSGPDLPRSPLPAALQLNERRNRATNIMQSWLTSQQPYSFWAIERFRFIPVLFRSCTFSSGRNTRTDFIFRQLKEEYREKSKAATGLANNLSSCQSKSKRRERFGCSFWTRTRLVAVYFAFDLMVNILFSRPETDVPGGQWFGIDYIDSIPVRSLFPQEDWTFSHSAVTWRPEWTQCRHGLAKLSFRSAFWAVNRTLCSDTWAWNRWNKFESM